LNPAAIAIAVADAVVDELQLAVARDAFTETFTPARSYDTELWRESADALQVHVLYGRPRVERITVGGWRVDVPIDICVRKAVSQGDTALCDGLAKLAGAILEYLASREPALAGYPDAKFVELPEGGLMPYLPTRLRQADLFVAVIELEYAVHGEMA